MKADLTRDTFDPRKHFRQVLAQQGRVQLDAELNEQGALDARRDETTTADIAGHCGGPADSAAFGMSAIAGQPGDFLLSAGRYYLDGIQCERESPVSYRQQPDLPGLPVLPAGAHLAYLDVWQRHVTFLDDRLLLETALGGVDTTTRVKNIWQVRTVPVSGTLDCKASYAEFTARTQASTIRLRARTQPVAGAGDPCQIAEGSGYTSLENQLYRVEIHSLQAADQARGTGRAAVWKWSRENGSVEVELKAVDVAGKELTVSSLGRDEKLGIRKGHFVEITDDSRELAGLHGDLIEVVDVDEGDVTITLKTAPAIVTTVNAALHPRVRRWEATANIQTNAWLELEAGIQVKFADVDHARPGDYWQISARTSAPGAQAGTIEWPQTVLGTVDALLPRGIAHHYCRLGFVTVSAGAPVFTDCRCLWPALTLVPRLFYVSGDGQEVMPFDPADPGKTIFKLPQPLIVGMANGHCAARAMKVRFAVDSPGTGRGVTTVGGLAASVANHVDVGIDADGRASCDFHLDKAANSQRVTAQLLDENDQSVSLPIIFNANLSVASEVAYDPQKCPNLAAAGARTVQDAIDILCKLDHGGKCCCVTVGKGGDFESLDKAIKELSKQKVRDICICLLPGDHEAKDISLANDGKGDLHLSITGCGRGTRLQLEKRVAFDGLTSFTMRELEIFSNAELKEGLAAFSFDSCKDVTITACRIAGVPTPGALLAIHDADHVRLGDNFLEAATPNSLDVTNEIFHLNNSTLFLTTLFSMTKWPEFNPAADDFGAELANLSTAERQTMYSDLVNAVNENVSELQFGDVFAFAKFVVSLRDDKTTANTYADLLRGIRSAAIKAHPGFAVVLGDAGASPSKKDPLGWVGSGAEDVYLVETNEISGVVCLMGQGKGIPIPDEDLKRLDVLLKGPSPNEKYGPARILGTSGTLQLRGNQLTHVWVAQVVIDQIQKVLKDGKGIITSVFGRCLLTDNVIEYATMLVGEQLSFIANKFTYEKMPEPDPIVSRPEPPVVTSIADSTVAVGNTLRGSWANASRIFAATANPVSLTQLT